LKDRLNPIIIDIDFCSWFLNAAKFSGGVFVLNSILLPSKGFYSKMFFEQAILDFYYLGFANCACRKQFTR